jgi:hypothetical protein
MITRSPRFLNGLLPNLYIFPGLSTHGLNNSNINIDEQRIVSAQKQKPERNHNMKTENFRTTMLIATMSLTLNCALAATDAAANLPEIGPGQGRGLDQAQRQIRHEQISGKLAELRQKKADGTLTADEQAWLTQLEQRGGWCVNGQPPKHAAALTAEHRKAWTDQVQAQLSELRAKKENGSLTDQETKQLARLEHQQIKIDQGLPPGPPHAETMAEWQAQCQKMQAAMADLKAKQQAGTLTPEELARLNTLEEFAPPCLNGPAALRGHGPRHEGMPGPGAGRGWQHRGAGGPPAE